MKNKATPRSVTISEARREFLETIAGLVQYWGTQPGQTQMSACDGLAFSILNIFDGTTLALPAMDIVLRPHPDDKAFQIKEGENWYQDGMAFNASATMHEEWGEYRPRGGAPPDNHGKAKGRAITKGRP